MIDRLFGRMMRGVHAGDKKLIWNHPAVYSVPETIEVSSSAFENGSPMPQRYWGKRIGGEDLSPPLEWWNLPNGAAEIVIAMEDPDAPMPFASMHLIATGIVPRAVAFPAGSLNSGTQLSQVRLGKGMLGRGYSGPTPPPLHGPHRYIFQVLALSQALRTDIVFNRKSLLKEIDGKVLAKGRLTGTVELN
jgi:Raf kinase inhibitor-like YbhB/YbcL family protein